MKLKFSQRSQIAIARKGNVGRKEERKSNDWPIEEKDSDKSQQSHQSRHLWQYLTVNHQRRVLSRQDIVSPSSLCRAELNHRHRRLHYQEVKDLLLDLLEILNLRRLQPYLDHLAPTNRLKSLHLLLRSLLRKYQLLGQSH